VQAGEPAKNSDTGRWVAHVPAWHCCGYQTKSKRVSMKLRSSRCGLSSRDVLSEILVQIFFTSISSPFGFYSCAARPTMFMSAESMPSPCLIDSIPYRSRIGVGGCNRRFFLHSSGVSVNSYDEKLSGWLDFCSTQSEVGLEKRPYLNTLLGGGCFLSKLPDAVRVIRLVLARAAGAPYSAPDCVRFSDAADVVGDLGSAPGSSGEPVLPRSTSMLCCASAAELAGCGSRV